MKRREKPEQIKKIINNLSNYHWIKKTIEADKKYLEESPLSAISYDGISTSPTYKVTSMAENIAIKRIERENRIKEYEDIIFQLDVAMTTLTEIEEEVIRLKYLEKYSWMQVEYHVRMCERQCRRIRDKALGKMQLHIYNEMFDYGSGGSQMAIGL